MHPTSIDLEFWGMLLATLTFQSLLIFAATGLACRRFTSAQWRRSLWQVCLVSLCVVACIELTGMGSEIGRWMGEWVSHGSSIAAAEPRSSFGETRTAVQWAESTVTSPTSTAASGRHPMLWPVAVWLLGCGLVLCRVVVAEILCARIRVRSKAAGGEIRREVDLVARLFAFYRRIRVLELGGLSGPIAFGVMSPTIVFPVDFLRRFEPRQRRAIVAHEVAHLVNRDPLWHLLVNIVVALLWWNPVAWLARRHLHDADEQCADEASALHPEGRVALAEALVRLGRESIGREAYGLGVNGGGFRSNLGKRIERLMSEGECRWIPIHWRWQWSRRLAAGSCLLVIAMFGSFFLPIKLSASGMETLASAVYASVFSSNLSQTAVSASDSAEVVTPVSAPVPEADLGESRAQVEITTRFVEFPEGAFNDEWILTSGRDWEIHPLSSPPEEASSESESYFFATDMHIGTFWWETFLDYTMVAGTDTLSAPKLTVLSGREAQTVVAEEVRGTGEYVPSEEGLQFAVLPTVTADGSSIHLELNAKVRERIDGDVASGIPEPHFRTREANVDSVTVADGETVVLSGFTRPADGNRVSARARDLVVFVTAKVVSSADD